MSARVGILHPEFSWHTAPTTEQLQKRLSTASRTPQLRGTVRTPFWLQRIVGFVHRKILFHVSIWYCRWYGLPVTGMIWPLPFGLVLKWSDGTRIEEVITTRALRKVGIPVPRIISYGAHPAYPHAPVSILMTRLPGTHPFGKLWEWFSPEEKETFTQQLKEIFGFIRRWGRDPSAKSALICSVIGTSIQSSRVPFSNMAPCADQTEFNRRLIKPADDSIDDFERRIARVRELDSMTHEIVFSHGDLAAHNILVTEDGRIGGLIDWESAGYYPEYWVYTTGWQFTKSDWWYDFVLELADGRYSKEHEGDLEKWYLTNGTMT